MLLIRVLLTTALIASQEPAFAQDASPSGRAAGGSGSDGDIVVTGARGRAPSLGALGDRSLIEAPYSIAIYDSALIKDAQLNRVSDLLKLEPSATVSMTSFGEGAAFKLRGFDLQGDFYTDGLPGLGGDRADPPLELYEGVQVLKGAAGFLYGFTQPGGVVNYITKRPKPQPFATIDLGYAQSGLFRGAVDAGTATDDGRFGVRVNAVGEAGTGEYGDTGVRRHAVGLNADAQVSNGTRLQADLLHSRRRIIGDSYGIYLSAGLAIPEPLSGSTRLGARGTGFEYNIDSAALRAVQEIGGGWHATIAAAITRTRFNFYDTVLSLDDAAGDADFGNFATNLRDTTKTAQLLVTGRATTGPMAHSVTLGGYIRRLDEELGRTAAGDTFSAAFSPAGNLYTGLRDTATLTEVPSLTRAYRSYATEEKALFASDTIGIGARWQVLAGLRYAWREQRDFNPDGSRAATQNVRKLTPNVAVLYKPTSRVTAYLSYAQSLQPGATAPNGTQNAGQRFPAIASEQYEAGIKADIGGLLLTAAAFRIDQGFAYQRAVASGLPIFTQDGIERHDGVEAQLSGRLGTAWRFAGGVQFLRARVRDSTPALVGTEPPAVPAAQAKMFAEYAPPSLGGATLNLTAIYTGPSRFDAGSIRRYEGATTLDAGARYRFSHLRVPITLRAAIDNLLGERYWLPRAGSLLPGAPRTVKLSATTEF